MSGPLKGPFLESVIPPAPPLSVSVPQGPAAKKPKPRLYHELFGADLRPLMEMKDRQLEPQQQRLIDQLLVGEKNVNNLNAREAEQLDQIAVEYNYAPAVQPKPHQRLPVPGRRPDVRPAPKPDLQDAPSESITSGYDWLK